MRAWLLYIKIMNKSICIYSFKYISGIINKKWSDMKYHAQNSHRPDTQRVSTHKTYKSSDSTSYMRNTYISQFKSVSR